MSISEDKTSLRRTPRPTVTRWCRSCRRVVLFASLTVLLTLTLGFLQRRHSQSARRLDDPPIWPKQITEEETSRNSAYTPSMFRSEQLEINHYLPVTAILNRIDTASGINYTVQHLLKYPYFKELYIYNQLHEEPLTTEQFEVMNNTRGTAAGIHHEEVPVHIYEKEPTEDNEDELDGRLELCAASIYDHCYFQDDTVLNLYLDSLYTQYMDRPDRIHAHIRSVDYLDNLRWRFENQDIGLHAGYADLRHGAFVPKSLVQSLLDQKDLVSFVLLSNQYPVLLANPSLRNGTEPATSVKAPHDDIYKALVRLEHDLSEQIRSSAENIKSDASAACHNDRCVFTTSMDPFSARRDVAFTSTNFSSIPQWDAMLREWEDTPSTWQPHLTVDQNLTTCWNSYLHPKAGDYFGLNMVGTIRAKRLVIYAHLRSETYSVSVKQNDQWVSCRTTLPADAQAAGRTVLKLEDCPGVQAFKAIRFTFTKDHHTPFELCGLAVDNMLV
ncbi:hypothetical protein BCR43DRAFT_494443 [Syncephalastrum racemosum]|uniref:Uncharacterized protein n=1 Tax=Syncephalastrum racemosum TaxID=13706 RepID=A0A1X2H832_SYNRA|nr:hypothetical protein BCR43DRAFT_494443 [Syncephalastrum racemosum]